MRVIGRLRTGLLLGLLLAGLATPAAVADAPHLEAGFGVVDITPNRPVPLGGYAERRGRPFRGVHDPVRARAVVFRQGDATLALVSVDLVGASRRLVALLRRRLADLELTDVVLTATHNHAGPGALTVVPLWRIAMGDFDARHFARTAARIEAAVRRAHADLGPVHAVATRVPTEGLVRNRATPGGPVDETLGVVRLDAPDGTPRGILLHFAAHPTILGASVREVSAGWPGALCDAVEREVEGATALFLQGAMGDVSPIAPPVDGGPFERAAAYGEALAGSALEAWRALAGRPAPSDLEVQGTRDVWAWTTAGRLLGRTEASALVPDEPWPLPVARFKVGGTAFATVPGEPVHAVGRRFQETGDWLVACAQDHFGYFTDRELFWRGDYEAELSLFGPGVVDRLLGNPRGPEPRPERRERARGPTREPLTLEGRVDPRSYFTHVPISDLGEAHGEALGPEICDLLRDAEVQFVREAMKNGAGLLLLPFTGRVGLRTRHLIAPGLVRAARRLQKHVPPEYLREMEGLAAAAQVPYDAILLENVFLTLAEQPDATALLRLPARCTNLVAQGDATSMGQLLHGSTLDWGMRDVLKPRTVALVMQPAEGHPFVSVTWPGMVGTLRAMGAQGLAITEESCAAPKDTELDGLPLPLLMRRVVQHASSLDEAVQWIREAPGTCGYKVTVSDGRALDARVVEVTGTRSHVRAPAKGLLFGCDPAAECVDGPCDANIPRNDGSSARRYPAVRRRLEPYAGRIRLGDVKASLALADGRVLNDGTLLACVFEPQLARFHLAIRDDVDPAGGRLGWRAYELGDALAEGTTCRPPWPVTDTGVVEARVRVKSFAGIRVEEVGFDSPVRSGLAVNDRVSAELFTPEDPVGAVVLLPHWKEPRGAPGQRLVALALARQGLAVLLLPLPYQYGRAPEGVRSGAMTLSADLARTREAAFQAAADVARASLWLEADRGFPPERQGVMGISLGGHIASFALGAYPDRFHAGAFLLAAAGVSQTILEENGVTDGIRRRLVQRGVTEAEIAGLLQDFDPADRARPDHAERVLLVAGTEDRVAPRARVEALAEAWGGARILWVEGGHYSVIRRAPSILQTVIDHLRARFGAK